MNAKSQMTPDRPPVGPGGPGGPSTGALVVLCACPDETLAERIARELVTAGLAACVNRLSAVRSIYRWKGVVQDEPEVLLAIKTTRSRYEELEMRLKALHPYEVPEIIALPVLAGAASYLAWLAEETRPVADTRNSL